VRVDLLSITIGGLMFHFKIKFDMKHQVFAKQKNKKIFNKNLKPFSEFSSAIFFLPKNYFQYIVIYVFSFFIDFFPANKT